MLIKRTLERAAHIAMRFVLSAAPSCGWLAVLALALSQQGLRAAEEVPADPLAPIHCRLIWTTDPAHQATVSWSTRSAGSSHRVHCRSAETAAMDVVECRTSGRFSPALENVELYYHHATLTGLKPATEYRLVLESDGQRSREFSFMSAPDDDRPIGLLMGGDSRSNQQARRAINERIVRLRSEHPSVVAMSHGGDYVANGTSLSEWSQWLSDLEATTDAQGRLLPLLPTRGNHDKGPLFNEVFGFAASDTNYYATQLGRQLRLITLNTETSIAGDQAKWLEQELKTARPANRWLVARYHRPAYPAVKSPSGALQFWVPLFDRFSVDLVYEADGHNIKRTVPIRDNVEDDLGVVYLGEGGLGAEQRKPKDKRWFLRAPGLASSGHHVHLLLFSPTEWESRAILTDGQVVDVYHRPYRVPAAVPQPVPTGAN